MILKFKTIIKRLIISILTYPRMARLLAAYLKENEDTEQYFKIFFQKDFFLLRKSYYLPIPDEVDMKYVKESELFGISMNDDWQLKFTNDVILKYKSEFLSFPIETKNNSSQYHIVNGSFMAGDGNAYYSLIRHLKPKTIIEIGSGNSTVLANHALEKNVEELKGYKCKFISIEPYPKPYLEKLSQLSELKQCKVQDVSLDYFSQLNAGDILFIDSSHVLKSGGDVIFEYCEIIPRLKAGVYIHIHDISLPKPYSPFYYDSHLYWNEQFMLQALLTNNDKLEVVWAGTYLFTKYFEKMKKAFCPEFDHMREVFPQAEPSSFWMRVK